MINLLNFELTIPTYAFDHRWASTSTSMSAISDIDICYSDIGRKYVGLKTVIPISEGFWYRHLSPFRYPISKKYLSHQQDSNPRHLFSQPLCWFMNFWMSYIGYRIKVYSDIRYNVGLCSLQSDIASSDIKLSPIMLITDIGVRAYLCFWPTLVFARQSL
jgi:hypothetical protein